NFLPCDICSSANSDPSPASRNSYYLIISVRGGDVFKNSWTSVRARLRSSDLPVIHSTIRKSSSSQKSVAQDRSVPRPTLPIDCARESKDAGACQRRTQTSWGKCIPIPKAEVATNTQPSPPLSLLSTIPRSSAESPA